MEYVEIGVYAIINRNYQENSSKASTACLKFVKLDIYSWSHVFDGSKPLAFNFKISMYVYRFRTILTRSKLIQITKTTCFLLSGALVHSPSDPATFVLPHRNQVISPVKSMRVRVPTLENRYPSEPNTTNSIMLPSQSFGHMQ